MGRIADFKKLCHEVERSGVHRQKPPRAGSVFRFFGYLLYSWKLMFIEKEIIVFSLLQWIAVALGVYLFTYMIGRPELLPLWQQLEQGNKAAEAALGTIMTVWGMICIGLVALPFSIFSSCIAAVHLIHYHEDRSSTVAECLRIVLPRAWALWGFVWFDLYLTVMKPHRGRGWKSWALEGLYQAWKIAAMCIHMNILTGRNWQDTYNNTLGMTKTQGWELLRIRIGYSFVTFTLYIGVFIAACFFARDLYPYFFAADQEQRTMMQAWMFIATIGVFWLGLVKVLVRPAYMIAISDIFADYVYSKNEAVLPSEPVPVAVSVFVAFAVFGAAVYTGYLYREPLGLTKWLGI